MVQLRLGCPTAKQVPLDEPGQVIADLEAHEAALRNGEDEVEVLKTAALGLLDEKEDEDEGDDVEARKEAEGACVSKAAIIITDSRIENRQEAAEEEIDGNGTGRAL